VENSASKISSAGAGRLTTLVFYFSIRSKTIDIHTFKKFVEDLASQKKIAPEELFHKLASCGPPGTSHATVRG